MDDKKRDDKKMNGKERFSAVMGGRGVDRRPVSLLLSLYGARLTGCPTETYYTDPAAYARGQAAVMDALQPDILMGPFAFCLEGQAFGSGVRFLADQAPNLAQPAVSSSAGLKTLSVPDIDAHPTLLFFRGAVERLAREYGDRAAIAAILLNPVDLPAMIMGIEGWLQTLLFDPDGTRRMLDLTVPYFVRWANAMLDAGASFVMMPNTFANPSIVTRDIVVRTTIPVLEDAFARVKGPLVIHSGAAPLTPFLDLYDDLPNVGAFVVNGGEDMAVARQTVGPEKTLVGNLDGPLMWQFGGAEIRRRCLDLLTKHRHDPRFIPGSCGPDIAYETPLENLLAFRKAVEEFT